MAINSTGAAWIENNAPSVTTYPLSIGAIVSPSAAMTSNMFWSLGTGTARNSFNIGMITNAWAVNVDNAGTLQNVLAPTAPTIGKWYFVLGRFLSTANRRIEYVALQDGNIQRNQGVTSIAFAGTFNRSRIVNRADNITTQQWNGSVAEWWITNTDVGLDAAAVVASPVLQELAYRGPFSVPYVGQNVQEYRSLREGLGSNQDFGSEVYFGGRGLQTWTYSGTPTLVAHPPLPNTYVHLRRHRGLIPV